MINTITIRDDTTRRSSCFNIFSLFITFCNMYSYTFYSYSFTLIRLSSKDAVIYSKSIFHLAKVRTAKNENCITRK